MPPSPIHRDPDLDGDDYGCFTDEANQQVAELVERVREAIESGDLDNAEAIVDEVKEGLQPIGQGATDTVVKENVFQALNTALCEADIRVGAAEIYGW